MIFNLLLKMHFFTVSKEKGIVFLYLVLIVFWLFYFTVLIFLFFSSFCKDFFNTQSEPFKHNYGINFLA